MRLLITGGTGSFGKAFIRKFLHSDLFHTIAIYSRDEFKQHEMTLDGSMQHPKLRFMVGDIRDKDRLTIAMRGVDVCIHAAALKQVPSCEYNPSEAIKTNVLGAMNVIDCAIIAGVKKVVALSTDKSVNPINLYGATKLCSDKLFVSACAYSPHTKFSVVRYGNVAGSRGSVIPIFKAIKDSGGNEYPITDMGMTRFWITIDEAVDLVVKAVQEMKGGETFIAKIPSFYIADLAKAFDDTCRYKIIGARPGEKLHEVMTTIYDNLVETEKYYVIHPQYDWYTYNNSRVYQHLDYASNINPDWLGVDAIKRRLECLI